VDFVIWLLFSRNKSSSSLRAPKHLLCQGFHQRHYPPTSKSMAATSIPGLYRGAPNHHSDALRRRPWPEVLALLGRAGDAIMADMLLDGAVFVPVEAGHGNYWQLSGQSVMVGVLCV
jgi:telomerase reverse transcriptase